MWHFIKGSPFSLLWSDHLWMNRLHMTKTQAMNNERPLMLIILQCFHDSRRFLVFSPLVRAFFFWYHSSVSMLLHPLIGVLCLVSPGTCFPLLVMHAGDRLTCLRNVVHEVPCSISVSAALCHLQLNAEL